MIELGFIHPESRFKILWEVYLLIVTVAVTIVAPLMVVFEKEITPRLLIFDILVTITFTADIVINFNTAFILRRQLIADRRRIAARYLKNWFFWDLIATLPLTWFFSPGRYAGVNRVLRFFRLARLLKLFGSSRTLGRARRLGLVNPAFTRLFLLVFWILVAAHLIACGWIFIGGPGEYIAEDFSTNGAVYLEAFYWTVTTLTTIGYGDITPANPLQFVYVIVVMLMGAAIYGFIIGNIANIIANIDVAKSQFRERVENIDTFLKYRNIPSNLQARIHDYFDYLWESRRGYEESNILRHLPTALKTQVSFCLNRDIIEKVPIFKDADPHFIRDIIMNLKPVIYTPGDNIVTAGEIGYEMFFISRGLVQVTNEAGTITYAALTAGQFFGEIALLLSTPRTATVRAEEYCDLYVLDKQTFDNVLQRYPNFAKNVAELAEARRRELGLEEEPEDSVGVVEEGAAEASGPVPAPPERLSHEVMDNGVLKISWLKLEGAERYEIIRRSKGEDKWKRLSGTLQNPVYLDLRAPKGEFAYRVRCANRYGSSRWSPPVTVRLD